MRENVLGFVNSRSVKSKGRLISSSLKAVFDEVGVSQRKGTIVLPTGGTPVNVTLGGSSDRTLTKKSPRWTHQNLKRLQSSMNISDKAIKYVI